jgi:protein tyrosine phosphatase (PTP) superfamily phosphohydrolase (DUF442 family)
MDIDARQGSQRFWCRPAIGEMAALRRKQMNGAAILINTRGDNEIDTQPSFWHFWMDARQAMLIDDTRDTVARAYENADCHY